jgi:hypothetical protein
MRVNFLLSKTTEIFVNPEGREIRRCDQNRKKITANADQHGKRYRLRSFANREGTLTVNAWPRSFTDIRFTS